MAKTSKQAAKTALRRKAEELLSSRPKHPARQSKTEQDVLIHELEVHQIELEMQNDELRKTQQALEDSHRKISDLYDYAPVGYASIDSNGLITKTNLTATELLGYQKRFLTGKPFTTLVHRGDQDAFHLHLRSLRAGSAKACEIRLYKKGRVSFDAQLVSVPFAEENGNGGVIHIAISDISERKQAEELARRRQSELEDLYRNAPVGLCGLDRDLRFFRINERMAEMNGIPAAAHFGKTVRELMPLVADAVEKGLRHVLETGKPKFNIEIVSQTPAQPGVERSWMEHWLPITDADDRVTGVSVVVEETTERKRAVEALRQSREDLDRAQAVGQIGWWRLNTQTNVLTWSAENHRIFGVPEGTPLSYESFLSIVHPDDRWYVDTQWQAGLLGEPYDIEHRIVVDGRVKWVREKAYLEFNGRGALVGGFGITQDITTRKETDEILRRTTEELAVTNKVLESFSYSIAHDLRAPLRTMKGFSNILLEDFSDKLDGDMRVYFDRIMKSADKMDELISDMLSLSKISRQEMNLQEVDMSAIAGSIVDDLRHAEPERKVEVIIAGGIKGYGDERLLRIALSNLLGNAWKYSGKTPGSRIEFGLLKKNDEHVYFIRDNGAGFDMAHADNLFMPFKRFHSDSQFAGTGIGLAIVNRVIRRHQGRIWAESETGKGATFYFTLVCKAD